MVHKTVQDNPTNSWQSMPSGIVDTSFLVDHRLELILGRVGTKDKPHSQTTDLKVNPLVNGRAVDGPSVNGTMFPAQVTVK